MNRIDAHHHLWRYDAAAYGWIGEGMDVLRRDFLPGDLKPLLASEGIRASIAVQARQTLDETAWLLALAADHPFIAGVVGWAPLASPDLPQLLERLVEQPRLVGLRHLIQDEADDGFILRPDFNRGIRALRGTRLCYDILVFARLLPQTIRFVDRHPDQIFVLDHLGKPTVREGGLQPWAQHLGELALRPNVYCKLSGLVTEANWSNWSINLLRPYFEVALTSFGPKRLMMGSDWPVCLLAASYGRWMDTVRSLIAGLSQDEQTRILGGTACEAYRLHLPTTAD